MIRVGFDPEELKGDALAWWQEWEDSARQATADLLQRWKEGSQIEPKRDAAVYRKLRTWLAKEVFHHKCGYCEKPLDKVSAEHYRPVAAVSAYEPVSQQYKQIKQADQKHPGYFWLAYEWQNIFPSCSECNDNPGKHTKFPLPPGRTHFLPNPQASDNQAPGTETLNQQERPLLLHPYFDDPEEHLVFGFAGLVSAKDESPRGKTTIEVCGLDREHLNTARQEVQNQLELLLSSARHHHQHTLGKAADVAQAAAIQDIWQYRCTPQTAFLQTRRQYLKL